MNFEYTRNLKTLASLENTTEEQRKLLSLTDQEKQRAVEDMDIDLDIDLDVDVDIDD